MSSRETYLVERIDRAKEAPVQKAARTQRQIHLRLRARRCVAALLKDLEDANEHGPILLDLIDMAAERLPGLIGKVEAATAFNARAADICSSLKLIGPTARDRAERVFTPPVAANDGGVG